MQWRTHMIHHHNAGARIFRLVFGAPPFSRVIFYYCFFCFVFCFFLRAVWRKRAREEEVENDRRRSCPRSAKEWRARLRGRIQLCVCMFRRNEYFCIILCTYRTASRVPSCIISPTKYTRTIWHLLNYSPHKILKR